MYGNGHVDTSIVLEIKAKTKLSSIYIFSMTMMNADEATCPFFEGLPVVPAKKNASGP